eukprot:390642-Prorocentrum_minimum.AAC.2
MSAGGMATASNPSPPAGVVITSFRAKRSFGRAVIWASTYGRYLQEPPPCAILSLPRNPPFHTGEDFHPGSSYIPEPVCFFRAVPAEIADGDAASAVPAKIADGDAAEAVGGGALNLLGGPACADRSVRRPISPTHSSASTCGTYRARNIPAAPNQRSATCGTYPEYTRGTRSALRPGSTPRTRRPFALCCTWVTDSSSIPPRFLLLGGDWFAHPRVALPVARLDGGQQVLHCLVTRLLARRQTQPRHAQRHTVPRLLRPGGAPRLRVTNINHAPLNINHTPLISTTHP